MGQRLGGVRADLLLLAVGAIMSVCALSRCTQPTLGQEIVCETHLPTVAVGMRKGERSVTHPCPVPGCDKSVVYAKLMCWQHWQDVPARLKAAVYRSWNGGDPLPDHARHCADAVEAAQRTEIKART